MKTGVTCGGNWRGFIVFVCLFFSKCKIHAYDFLACMCFLVFFSGKHTGGTISEGATLRHILTEFRSPWAPTTTNTAARVQVQDTNAAIQDGFVGGFGAAERSEPFFTLMSKAARSSHS